LFESIELIRSARRFQRECHFRHQLPHERRGTGRPTASETRRASAVRAHPRPRGAVILRRHVPAESLWRASLRLRLSLLRLFRLRVRQPESTLRGLKEVVRSSGALPKGTTATSVSPPSS
jgi:hypothetical protein